MSRRPYYIFVFILSLSLFIFELTVNRLFAAILSSNHSYLVISLAILGLGLGGIITHLLVQKRLFKTSLLIWAYFFLYIITISLIFFLPFPGSVFWYILLGMLPFLAGGVLLSRLFQVQPNTFLVYLLDLLGGVSGLFLAYWMMNSLGMTRMIVFSFAIASLVVIAGLARSKSSIVALFLLAAILLGNGFLADLYGNNFISYQTSPYVGMAGARSISYTYWDSYARTDVFVPEQEDRYQIVGINGRAFSRMFRFNGQDLSRLEFLKDSIGYIPIGTKRPEKIAIIGPGGGEDILYALLAGAREITAVEINQGAVNAQKELGEYSGNIYENSRVKTVVGDGRSFIKNTDEVFDQINLSLVMTNVSDGIINNMAENYIYTPQALRDYFSKLADDGWISFLLHSQNDLLKMLMTAISYYQEAGVPVSQIADRIVMGVKQSPQDHDMLHYPVLVLKKVPFNEEEISELAAAFAAIGANPIHLPGIKEEDFLNQYSKGIATVAAAVKQYPYDIEPTSDDRPFFYDFKKELPSGLIPLLLAGILILITSWLYGLRKGPDRYLDYHWALTLLGFGFIMVEISLIQKLTVFLGHPARSFVVVIAFLLLGAGIANMYKVKLQNLTGKRSLILLLIFGLVVIMLINYVQLTSITILTRILILSALLLPLGFFAGIPFPVVLHALRNKAGEKFLPFCWGVNGIATVVGSVLTLIIALRFGFTAAYLTGMVSYLLALGFLWRLNI